MDKKEYIAKVADMLVATNTTMTGETLATLLNWNDFRTGYDKEYSGTRGTYTLIHATYNWLADSGRQPDADKVALAFKKPNGTYAYDK
jgi:hypothetical protein